MEAAATEAKGTVLIEDAEEMVNYNKSEEAMMEANIKAVAESGATVVVSGGSISEMAMHFLDKYNLLAIKIMSKFELRRICRATGATAVMRLGAVMPEEMGSCDEVSVQEIGGRKNVVSRQVSERVLSAFGVLSLESGVGESGRLEFGRKFV